MAVRVCPLLAASAVALAFTAPAAAAPPWVDRHITLPGGDVAFDAGVGVGHAHFGPVTVFPTGLPPVTQDQDSTTTGINAELAIGITDRVEVGARTGIRFGDAFDRQVRADQYGRLFDRQTFGTGADTVANPELRVRGAVVRHRVVEVALEGRLVLPIESGTDAGALFGAPLAFHLGRVARLDTGAFVPVVFDHPTRAAISVPVDLWLQASRRLWLGPMSGVVVDGIGGPGNLEGSMSLGFGLGYEITHYLDFKAMVLFPALTRDDRSFGLGAGIELRIE